MLDFKNRGEGGEKGHGSAHSSPHTKGTDPPSRRKRSLDSYT